ncbi:MAG: hypothetical protein A2063_05915 [Gallionellales bacterium GWA2_60_142]|nr:MAG: hypothetical protein A2063_05915 [Gallionellales bacterium GWA2_60_142]HCI13059.1 hypothetical protein [Gallionellaceae bacterium]
MPHAWFIGGVPVEQLGVATFYLDIKVTEGTNTKSEKAEYISRVFASMEEILGNVAPASYIVIHEVHAETLVNLVGKTQADAVL